MNAKGRSAMLPVDAFYPRLNLVVEYSERQHNEAVPFFDGRMTVSGYTRGIQRHIYDRRRREVLPVHGVEVVILSHEQFPCDGRKRLLRQTVVDMAVIKEKLFAWLPR